MPPDTSSVTSEGTTFLRDPGSFGMLILTVLHWVRGVIDKFRNDALSLYETKDRLQGFIVSTDREGREKNFPLLSASAAVLHIPDMVRNYSTDQIGTIMAALKKNAKSSPDRIAVATLGPDTVPSENGQ